LTELPNVNEEAWDVLFTNDIFQYVQENGYSSVISDRTMTILNTGRILDQKASVL